MPAGGDRGSEDRRQANAVISNQRYNLVMETAAAHRQNTYTRREVTSKSNKTRQAVVRDQPISIQFSRVMTNNDRIKVYLLRQLSTSAAVAERRDKRHYCNAAGAIH